MSEQTSNTSQMVVIGLAVVAVLLAAIAGILVWQQSQAAQIPVPAATAPAATAPAGMGGAPAGMGAATGAPVEFDEKTATKVPEGTTPADFVKGYHEAVKAGDYDAAYTMLPLDKQQSYGDAKSYAEQLKAYGITGYEMGEPTEDGDIFTVVATQITPQMPIGYLWTLKKVGDTWYVAARTMGTN